MSTENAIEALGIDFWRWRTLQQPRSHDDIPRIERNKNWKPAWSSQDVAGYQNAISDFQIRWKAIDAGTVNSLKVSKESWVDYQLIGSAIHRVYWELDYLKVWQQQPRFYIDQTAGVVFDLLLPIQVNDEIVRDVVFALNFTEEILSSGIKNLANNAVKAYAVVAIDLLKNIENQLNTMSKELAEFVDQDLADALEVSTKKAIGAFVIYREWLISNLDSFKPISAIGKDNYEWFFKNVALVPFTTHELNMIGELEWDRAVVLEQISLNKHKKIAIPAIPSSAAEQVKNEANDEDIMFFSFYPTKPVGSCDGGMIVSNDLKKIEWIREAVMNGMSYSDNNWERTIKFPGYKMYMNSIQCFIANENLNKLESNKYDLKIVRDYYNAELSLNNNSDHLYRISVDNNKEFIKYMHDNNVVCGIHYDSQHKNPVYNSGLKFDCLKSEEASKRTVSIPFNPKLTMEEMNKILKLIKKYKR